MMAPTHHVAGSAWWLTGVLAANLAGAGINPVVAATGAVIAPVFAAGWLSPDADVSWLKRLGHRRATHRPDTTAVYLTLGSGIVWLVAIPLAPAGTHWLALAPVTGWWSHLIGDAIFGRIPFGPAVGGVLLAALPDRLARRGRDGTVWVGFGFDTDGLLERGTIRLKERTASGLHKTRRPWWMFGLRPATDGLTLATVVLLGLVTWQSATGGAS